MADVDKKKYVIIHLDFVGGHPQWDALEQRMNELAAEGYELVRTEIRNINMLIVFMARRV